MAGTEGTIDKYDKHVEGTFGKCKLNKHACTTCVVRCTKDEDGNVNLGQDEYIASSSVQCDILNLLAPTLTLRHPR
eukprot:3323479-Pyramimonas_sp.AAC.1